MITPPPSPRSPGDAVPLLLHERSRLRAAAEHAHRALPGPVGDLVHRELVAYADFGYRTTSDALIPRLAADVLALPAVVPPPPARRPFGRPRLSLP
jgi:hypothetical protein